MLASRSAAARWLKRGMMGLAGVSFAVAAYDCLFGGFSFAPFGVRISSWEAYKPFRNGVVCACVALWLTYLLGERTCGRRTGFLAAILLTCSPIFLFQSLEPMSDVPATAWWLAAWVFAISDGAAAALLAGLAASASVVTRPNLVPLALVLTGAVILVRPRVARAVWFAVGLVPGCLAIAALNKAL